MVAHKAPRALWTNRPGVCAAPKGFSLSLCRRDPWVCQWTLTSCPDLPRSECRPRVTACLRKLCRNRGDLTADHRRRILQAIDQTRYYDLEANPHRYYLVDSFIETDARKTSSQGIWGMRRLDLSKMVPNFNPRKRYATHEIAAALRGKTWE